MIIPKILNNNKKFLFLHEITIIFFVFVISRLITFFYLELDISNISYGYHLLNIELVKKDFLKSLLYLHSQPYLWNFFNGLIVKIFDGKIYYISKFLFNFFKN